MKKMKQYNLNSLAIFLLFLCAHLLTNSLEEDSVTLPSSIEAKYQALSVENIPAGVSAEDYYQDLERDLYFPSTMPTKSINEAAIEETFGSTGIGLATDFVTRIKQAYCFLEFVYKLDQVKNNPDYFTYQSYYQDYINNESGSTLILPSATLVDSEGWDAIATTGSNLMSTDCWQMFIKSLIANCYSNDSTTIATLYPVKIKIFYYIPNIETSYYTSDFTALRTLEEILRIKAVLHSNMRTFFLAQTLDWKDQKPSEIIDEINTFKESDFFTAVSPTTSDAVDTSLFEQSPLREQAWLYFMFKNLIADLYNVLSLKNLNKITSNISSSKISPCFSDLNHDDLAILYDFYSLQETNLTTSSENDVIENQPTGTVSAQGLFKKKKNEKKSAAKQPSKKSIFNPEELRHKHTLAFGHRNHPFTKTAEARKKEYAKQLESKKQPANTPLKNNIKSVKAQDFGSDLGDFFISAGASISKALDEAWQGLEAAGMALVDFLKSAGESFVGWGATVIGLIGGDQSLIDFGEDLEAQGIADAQAGMAELDIMIEDFGAAIEDGIIAPIADITGAFVSMITGDIKAGKDTVGLIEDIADELVNLTTEAVEWLVNQEGEAIIGLVQLTEDVTNIMAESVVAMYAGGDAESISDLTDSAITLLKDVAISILNAVTVLYSSGKEVFTSVMNLLSVVVNSITTIFIDIVREVTFIFSALSEALGAQIDADEIENEVTQTLEDNRQTINQVVGVVLAVAIDVAVTVATLGTATGPLIAAELAAEAAAEGLELATEAAAIAAEAAEAATAAVEAATIAAEAAEGTEAAVEMAEIAAEAEAAATEAAEAAEEAAEALTEAEEASETANVALKAAEAAEEAAKDALTIGQKIKSAFQSILKFTGAIMNGGFGIFNTISGVNADAENNLQKAQEEQYIRNLWSGVSDATISNVQSQASFIDELANKQGAEIANKTLGLNYYTNYLNATIDNYQNIIAENMTVEQIYYLTPDANGLQPANIGTSWGIVTPFFNLYPSQGFASATTGRSDFPFAQEIAEAPISDSSSSDSTADSTTDSAESANQDDADSTTGSLESFDELSKILPTSEDTSSATNSSEKFWFNQRVVANAEKTATDMLEVEIKFNIIYMLNSEFYAGMFVGGTHYDYSSSEYLAGLNSNSLVDLDAIRLAKLFVLFRRSVTEPWQIGLYEPGGQGWIVQEVLDTSFYDDAYTYHMKANLDQTNLTVSFWKESNPDAIWTKTVTVSATDQRPYGTIFSGVAMEWGVINPTVTLTTNSAIYTVPTTTEVDRNKTAITSRQKNITPTFGSIILEPITFRQALNQSYLYRTTSTNITDQSGADLKNADGSAVYDYVVFATNTSGVVTNIGTTPSDTTANVVVSLISGKMYNSSGQLLSTQIGIWNAYKNATNSIDNATYSYIKTTRSTIMSDLLLFSFSGKIFTAADSEALFNDQYLYTSDTTISEKALDGSTIIDYLITCSLDSGNRVTTYGAAPNATTSACISLITGTIFTSEGSSFASSYNLLSNYTSVYGSLPSSVATALAQSQTDYAAQQTDTTEQASTTSTAAAPVLLKAVSSSSVATDNDFGLDSATELETGTTSESISSRAIQAADNDFPF